MSLRDTDNEFEIVSLRDTSRYELVLHILVAFRNTKDEFETVSQSDTGNDGLVFYISGVH